MLYAAAAILIVLGFVFPKNKIVNIAILLYMWVLFAFNTWNADYMNYYWIYERIGTGDLWGTTVSEEGFVYLCYFFRHDLGWTYAEFLVFVATVCTILLKIVVDLFSKRPNTVLALSILYPYWIMVCQYRSYIATLFSMIGIYFLFFDPKKESRYFFKRNNKIQRIMQSDTFRSAMFFVFIFIGVLFHRTAVFFAIFYIAKKFDTKRLVIITSVLFVMLFALHLPFMANFLSHFMSRSKINTWLLSDGTRTIVGLFFLVVVRIGTVIVEYFMLDSYRKSGSVSKEYLHFVEMVFKTTLISLSFLSLELYVKDYERLARVTLLLSYCIFADFLMQKKVKAEKIPVTYFVFIAFYLVHTAYYFYVRGGYLDIAFYPLFEHNSLIA